MKAFVALLAKYHKTKQNDLLGLMICLAAIFHTTIIFGIGFAPEDRHIGKVLDVSLASFKDDKAPDKADFIAQENQLGSGTEDKALMPRATAPAEFQATEISPAPSPLPSMEEEQEPQEANKNVLTANSKQQEQAAKQTEKKQQEGQAKQTINNNDWAAQIASLEAQIAEKEQAYAKRPRILQITSAATKKDKGAAYQDGWRKKIERIGNLNYPKEASAKKIYGKLRLLVAIKKNGQLHAVKVLKSSGKPVLDRAAIRIVHMAAPFPPFPKELADTDIIEIIRTWQFDRSDKLSTER